MSNEINEEGEAVGTGSVMTTHSGIAGLPPDLPPMGKGLNITSKMLRRKKVKPHSTFRESAVFNVDPDTYYKALFGKRKVEHYEKYIGECEVGQDIRAYGLQNWDKPIILRNEQTGAMLYLKYGKGR
jgi:hypothetical protein